MKEERTHRLFLLQAYLDLSSSCGISRRKSKIYDPSVETLVVSWKDCNDIVKGLRSQDVVSQYYNSSCLNVDLWYLSRDITFNPGKERSAITLSTVESRLLFQIVVQSLLDLRNGRPCDLKCWRKDISPDFETCTESHHICWNSAEQYLTTFQPEAEQYIGLSEGALKDLVCRIKKDKIFDILFLIPTKKEFSQ